MNCILEAPIPLTCKSPSLDHKHGFDFGQFNLEKDNLNPFIVEGVPHSGFARGCIAQNQNRDHKWSLLSSSSGGCWEHLEDWNRGWAVMGHSTLVSFSQKCSTLNGNPTWIPP